MTHSGRMPLLGELWRQWGMWYGSLTSKYGSVFSETESLQQAFISP